MAHTVRNIALALLTPLLAALLSCSETVVSRSHIRLNKDWAFALGEHPGAYKADFDDSEWRRLTIPHDWSIEGSFSEDNPAGCGGGALPGGVGWYRNKFTLSDADLGGRVSLQFDGVYMNSFVYVNGKEVGRRPYGYSSSVYDVTKYVRSGTNVVSVRVDNSDQPNSRWYSGSGIYRNVWLNKTNNIHVANWGTHVCQRIVNTTKADLEFFTTIANETDLGADVDIITTIKDGRLEIHSDRRTIHVDAESKIEVKQDIRVDKPKFWDVSSPHMYLAETRLVLNGDEVDRYDTPFGIRTIYFDSENGFILNDKHLKINGVCLHHDLGCLGAAINVRAMERQLEILKEMGCNAIRCSHNPPAPELLDLCDRMGFLVMDEAFDMWRKKKTAHDYARFFDEWHEKDLRDMVVRDRNHPSVFIWSIGNEVLEQWTDVNADTLDIKRANLLLNKNKDEQPMWVQGEGQNINSLLCRRLADIVHALDPSRPVTTGNNESKPTNNLFKANVLDIVGYNYHNSDIDSVPTWFPGKPFIITESNSALMTRGYYKMPSTSPIIWPEKWDKPFHDPSFSCSSYDHCRVPWGSTHESTMLKVRDNPFVCGQFVWTGFDYIGEPTPFWWPARSSYFGIVDLAGFPKDVYYLYQSEWQTEKTVLHLFPHWNWRSGEDVDVWCYYNNADEVELYVNGRSAGVRKKDDHTLHAMWRVSYEPGYIRVVSRKDGHVVASKTINTAGRPYALRLTADRRKIKADGDDLSFVTVEIVDRDGNLCPNAQNEVQFAVEGMATIAGVDNGSPISLESFKADHRKAYYGKCLVVLRSNGETGNVRLTATSESLKHAELTINCLSENTY